MITGIIDTIAPIKEVRLKQRTDPWISCDILNDIKNRDIILYQFKKDKSKKLFYKEYCMLRNKIQRNVRRAKSEYYLNKIEENKNNHKKLWQHLKDLGYSSKIKESKNIVLDIGGAICYDPLKIANSFNEFFTNIASVVVDKLPSPSNIFTTDSAIFKNFYQDKGICSGSFKLGCVSEEFIERELLQLNPNKSTGLDNIPARFLRDGSTILKAPITHIVNMSIISNSVPNQVKLAKVKPLFKKNNNTDVNNYRPVSVLSAVSKILEKAVYMYVELEKYLIDNSILYEYQSGFRSSYSTDSCLIHLMDHIKTQSSRGLFTGMVMLDLQKAFDTVNHHILCEKLSVIGVESVEWFYSYLSNRRQVVHINGVESNYLNVLCGVPQGSILGPLLFLCYINDMVVSVDPECKLLLKCRR